MGRPDADQGGIKDALAGNYLFYSSLAVFVAAFSVGVGARSPNLK